MLLSFEPIVGVDLLHRHAEVNREPPIRLHLLDDSVEQSETASTIGLGTLACRAAAGRRWVAGASDGVVAEACACVLHHVSGVFVCRLEPRWLRW